MSVEKPLNTFTGDGGKTVVTYNCKFCRRPGAIEMEDEPNIQIQIAKWQPILCCNRCAGYREVRYGIRDRIQGVVEYMIQMKSLRALTQELETGIRSKLASHTKGYATAVNQHYRKVNVWEKDFVDIIMERPDMWARILNDYERRRMSA